MRHSESATQQACIRWFALQHRGLWEAKKLYAVPNGGHRNKVTAAVLKKEGARAGVWDLHLTIPAGRWMGLWIEMKHGRNTLTEEQEAFQKSHEEQYCFAVCRTVEEFIQAVTDYLALAGYDKAARPMCGIGY